MIGQLRHMAFGLVVEYHVVVVETISYYSRYSFCEYIIMPNSSDNNTGSSQNSRIVRVRDVSSY